MQLHPVGGGRSGGLGDRRYLAIGILVAFGSPWTFASYRAGISLRSKKQDGLKRGIEARLFTVHSEPFLERETCINFAINHFVKFLVEKCYINTHNVSNNA